VLVDDTVQVPREYVKNGEIVLNVSFDATSGLKLGNEFIEFKARFAGAAREIMVPVDRVIAIYARENGQGMAFPVPVGCSRLQDDATSTSPRPRQAAVAVPVSQRAQHAADTKVVQLVRQTAGHGRRRRRCNPTDPPRRRASARHSSASSNGMRSG
jgi:stringent starvation protein B